MAFFFFMKSVLRGVHSGPNWTKSSNPGLNFPYKQDYCKWPFWPFWNISHNCWKITHLFLKQLSVNWSRSIHLVLKHWGASSRSQPLFNVWNTVWEEPKKSQKSQLSDGSYKKLPKELELRIGSCSWHRDPELTPRLCLHNMKTGSGTVLLALLGAGFPGLINYF